MTEDPDSTFGPDKLHRPNDETVTHRKIHQVEDERNEGNQGCDTRDERGEQKANPVRGECGEESEEGDGRGDGVEDESAREVMHGGSGSVTEAGVVHVGDDTGHVVSDGFTRALITDDNNNDGDRVRENHY